MKQKSNLLKLAGMGVFSIAVLMGSCKKNGHQDLVEATNSATKSTAQTSAFPSDINTSFTHSDGTYTSSVASSDFGSASITGWNDTRAYISGGWARATLLPNALSGAGGLIANIDISDGSAYELDFKVRFHSQFDWSRGGKVGFGFLVGEGNTGCDKADDGNGGSLRLMWYNDDSGHVYFRPYAYYKDMPGVCGNDFGKQYPSSGNLQKGVEYSIHMYIKSNTGSSTNGQAQIKVNGTTLLDMPIRWTTNDAERLIKRVSFHTFRGGSQSYWESSGTSYIYYDDLVVHKISN